MIKAKVEYVDCERTGGGYYEIIIEGFPELVGAKVFQDYEKNAKKEAQKYARKINKKLKELNIIGEGKIHYSRC